MEMRLTVRPIAVLAAVVLTAIPIMERPQTATANGDRGPNTPDLCESVIEPARASGPGTIAASLMMFAGRPEIAASLSWSSIFHNHAVAPRKEFGLTTESFKSSPL